MDGSGSCAKTTTTAKIPNTTSIQVPMTSCPAGSMGPGADGMCTTTRTIRVPEVSSRDVPVTTTTVEKTPFSVPVSTLWLLHVRRCLHRDWILH
uniref:Uncharacterized protein n=1 Tax=Chromera velia CCMP2878 TaxID=1169474 RepID=A0A0G4HRA0_9ALVE|eukprot:Cvel_30525.t1-p1 / transcript=Cvel_30525.t1 / gene=Cvel_30525 / organism=Chromera_velia_CCMP2878 / gene_product=hypothetical protein / transcript_product=hypothetical protein / location=Cvel_scaffold4365:56-334(+) / protein_length=93 / sequence_SO=supercontig / SO=protein_coding / is_pseudo=false